ncbi:hypothetical protein ACVIW2_007597 [Bradyrhizobium huanghuaihaiense]
MTDLQPHRYPNPPAPLTAGARFIRGFKRIGAAAAILVALIGVGTTVVIAVDNYNSTQTSYQGAKCISGLARTGYKFPKKEYSSYPDYSSGGCVGYYRHSYNTLAEVIAIADAPAPSFLTTEAPTMLGWGFLITGLLALVTYLVFWAIGWLCAGFTRDA